MQLFAECCVLVPDWRVIVNRHVVFMKKIKPVSLRTGTQLTIRQALVTALPPYLRYYQYYLWPFRVVSTNRCDAIVCVVVAVVVDVVVKARVRVRPA